MSKLLKLTKPRLYELLDLYHPKVEISRHGGYDTGIYFSFSGNRKPEYNDIPYIVGGRRQRKYGFESELMKVNGLKTDDGITRLYERVEVRQAQLIEWINEYYTRKSV